jgi:VCBS repeat-containing protein
VVLNELIYDANSTSNSSLISLVKGTFTFVGGQVAHTGDMKLDTPVATMGIRGTAGTTTVNADATGTVYEVHFSLMPDPDGHVGLIQVLDRVTGLVIGTISTTANVLSVQPTANFQIIANESPKAAAQVQAELAAAQVLYPAYQAVAATVAAPPAPAPPTGPQGGQQQNNSPPGGSLNIPQQTGPTVTFSANVNADTNTVTATKVTVDPTPTVTPPPPPTTPNPTVTTPTPPPEPPPPGITATTPPHLQELGADQPGTLVSVATLTVTGQIDINALASAGWAAPAGAPSTFFQKDFPHGTASLDISNSTLTYSLNLADPSVAALQPNQTLQDSVTVPVQGGPSTTVDFTIDGVTHPTGQDASVSVSESLPTHTTQIILHPQATDPISSHLTYSAENLQGSSGNSTGHGTVVANPDGSFTYTPNAGFYGTDTITFKAHDGPFLTSDDFTVTVNVSLAAPNDAAAAQVDVNHGVVTGNLLAGDPNQDVLTVTDVINDAGTDGTFTVDGTYGASVGFSITGSEAGADGLPITVTIVDGNGAVVESYNITGAQGGWSVDVTNAQAMALADGSYTVTAQVTDQFGNPSTAATQTLEVHETLPTVTISTVAADGDNVINRAEAQDGVTLSGTVTGLAADSTFSITATDGSFSHAYHATVNAAGTGWTATIPSDDATQLQDGTSALTVTAQVSDPFGNASATATQTFTVEETLPTVTIDALALDGDNVINHAEAQDGVTLSGSVTGQAALSTFSITVIDGSFTNTYSAVVNTAGTGWTATIPGEDATQLQDGVGALTVSAQVTDQFGNTSATATQTFTVEETLPTVTISAFAADGDNVINHTEAQGGVTLGGSVTGLAANSTFSITVTDGSFSQTYQATVNAAGTGWTATIPGEDATQLQDGVGALTVTAQVTDQFGNTSATATQTFTVDETAPTVTINTLAGDNVLNALEAQADLAISGTTSGVENGQHVTVTFNGHSYDAVVASNAWTTSVAAANLAHAILPDGSYTVTANVSDAAGNPASSATQTFTVNEAPSVILPGQTTASGSIVVPAGAAGSPLTALAASYLADGHDLVTGSAARLDSARTFSLSATTIQAAPSTSRRCSDRRG